MSPKRNVTLTIVAGALFIGLTLSTTPAQVQTVCSVNYRTVRRSLAR